jgi:hypothetical protein
MPPNLNLSQIYGEFSKLFSFKKMVIPGPKRGYATNLYLFIHICAKFQTKKKRRAAIYPALVNQHPH